MAIKSVRLPGGEEFRLDEWVDWALFSTVEAQAGISVDLSAFTYVVGQRIPQAGVISTGGRTATIADTNQVARARINHDEAYIAFGLTYEVFALEGTTNANADYPVPPLDVAQVAPALFGTNLARLRRDLIYSLLVGAGITKPMASAPLSYYGQAFGTPAYGPGDALAVTIGAAASLNFNYATAGQPSPRNVRRWRLPVYIGSDRVMRVRLHSPGTGDGNGALNDVDQDWRFRAYMVGLKRRAVA